MAMNQIEHHDIQGVVVAIRNRAFISPNVREIAVRHFIDDMLQRLDISQVPINVLDEVQEHINNMHRARQTSDICIRSRYAVRSLGSILGCRTSLLSLMSLWVRLLADLSRFTREHERTSL